MKEKEYIQTPIKVEKELHKKAKKIAIDLEIPMGEVYGKIVEKIISMDEEAIKNFIKS